MTHGRIVIIRISDADISVPSMATAHHGFAIVECDDAGLDADEWCERLKEKIGNRKLTLCVAA